MKIVLSKEVATQIISHAQNSSSEECCGILVGKEEKGLIQVVASFQVENTTSEGKKRTYRIDPFEIYRLEVELRGTGLEPIGFYHSHPHGDATPSSRDCEDAWPGYLYLIATPCGQLRCWLYHEKEGFKEETLTIS